MPLPAGNHHSRLAKLQNKQIMLALHVTQISFLKNSLNKQMHIHFNSATCVPCQIQTSAAQLQLPYACTDTAEKFVHCTKRALRFLLGVYTCTCIMDNMPLTPASHMEVGCPGTWGLELLNLNPGSKSTPQASRTRNPATRPRPPHPAPAQAPVTQSQELCENNNNSNNE